ncbi:MAG: hypothetical protein ACR2LJ_10885 [Acidimicrobiales bacterium]
MSDHTHAELDDHGGRLEALETRIQRLEKALQSSEAAGPGEKYYESGTIHPELDDQEIAP